MTNLTSIDLAYAITYVSSRQFWASSVLGIVSSGHRQFWASLVLGNRWFWASLVLGIVGSGHRWFWASLVLGIVDRPGDQDGRDQILAGARPAGR